MKYKGKPGFWPRTLTLWFLVFFLCFLDKWTGHPFDFTKNLLIVFVARYLMDTSGRED